MLNTSLKKIGLFNCFALAITCCCCISRVLAQPKQDKYTISHQLLGIEYGLAANEVFCGLQDGQGFIWFGTRNGLNRYDGKKMQLFTRQDYQMQDNNIVKLATDMHSQLFIQYGNPGYQRMAIGKVDILNQQTLKVASLTQTFKDLPFKEANVYWITNDGTDRVNIMTKSPYQLWQYTAKDGFKLRFEMKPWNTGYYKYSDPTGPYSFFYKDFVCMGFGGHETQYFINGNQISQFSPDVSLNYLPVNLNSHREFMVHYNSNDYKRLGFFSMDKNGKLNDGFNAKDAHLADLEGFGGTPFPVANDTTCIFHVVDKGIFLYTGNSLLEIVGASRLKKFTNFMLHEAFADQLGNTWICTSVGTYKIKVKQNRFTHYFSKQQQQLEANNQVRGIWQDAEGTVYANVWDKFFIQQKDRQKAINTFGVNFALLSHLGKLYSTNYPLQEYLFKENKFKRLANTDSGRSILSAASLNDSMLLLGKMEYVYTYNLRTHELVEKHFRNKVISMPYRFLKRKDGTIWVVGESGLQLLNSKGDIIDYFDAENKEAGHQLPKGNFTDIFEDEQGTIWLTTSGDGLCKWNRKLNNFTHFSIKEGMPSSVLYRMESDGKNHLWISTENGLVCFNMQNETMNSFFVSDGLSDNEFNRMSSYKASDGRLFFGGMNGVNAFYPNEIINDASNAKAALRIVSFQQFSANADKLVDLTAELLQHQKIVLNPGDQFFNIEFRLLDYENKTNQYAYKIEAQDKDWNYTTESSIRISGLPYGKYTLHIKGQNVNGQWSSSELLIPIEVLAPLYRKIWFQLLLLAIAASIVFLAFKLRTKKLQMDKHRLEETVTTRTNELQKSLGERELLLKEIHHRVKNNLQIISGLLDLQKEEIEAEESKAVFNEGQSRVKSIALIHQNLYQNDNLANIKFSSFVKELTVQVGEVFEQLNAKLEIDIDMPDLILDIDTAVPLGLIINELLTNAFKYATSKNKTGLVTISLKDQGDGNYLLRFADDGPGIQQGIDFEEASTLGLRLIKGLASQLYGQAAYRYDNGSVFTIAFKDSDTRKLES